MIGSDSSDSGSDDDADSAPPPPKKNKASGSGSAFLPSLFDFGLQSRLCLFLLSLSPLRFVYEQVRATSFKETEERLISLQHKPTSPMFPSYSLNINQTALHFHFL
jgi:hypothetical protein